MSALAQKKPNILVIWGDRDEHLPTNHGFDAFFGNLYLLNAEEEPELPDYPDPKKYPDFRKKFGPRGVIHSYADGRIEDTGPLTKKRMETVDDETVAAAKRFIRNAAKADKPFFVWWNGTRMHFRTHDERWAEFMFLDSIDSERFYANNPG